MYIQFLGAFTNVEIRNSNSKPGEVFCTGSVVENQSTFNKQTNTYDQNPLYLSFIWGNYIAKKLQEYGGGKGLQALISWELKPNNYTDKNGKVVNTTQLSIDKFTVIKYPKKSEFVWVSSQVNQTGQYQQTPNFLNPQNPQPQQYPTINTQPQPQSSQVSSIPGQFEENKSFDFSNINIPQQTVQQPVQQSVPQPTQSLPQNTMMPQSIWQAPIPVTPMVENVVSDFDFSQM